MEDLIERVRKFCEDIVSNASEQVAKHGAAGASVESAHSAVACDILGMIRNAPPAQPAFTADEVRAILGEVGILTSHGNATRVAEKLAGRAVGLSGADRSDLEYLAGWCHASVGDIHVDRARFERALAAFERVLATEPRPVGDPAQREAVSRAQRYRIEDLAGWLRYALENWAPAGSDKAEKARAALDAADVQVKAQREADLREAYQRGCDFVLARAGDLPEIYVCHEAAAEYARSKVGQ